MNNRQRETKNKSNGVVGVAVVAGLALLELVTSSVSGAGIIGFITVVLILGIAGFAVAFVLAKKKKGANTGSVYHAERGREVAKRMFMREELGEETIKCTHPRGREKYIQQLDNFLANGLIDKAEYRVLKERYEKVVIPENMH